MEFAANTVLITGGASGIGFALAERFILAGSSVIICGRREHKLIEVQSKYPQLHIRVCDVAKGLHTFGAPLDEFTDGIVEQLKMGSIEATYGFSAESSRASREQLEAIFKQMNQ